jgi:NAD(P)-dependent dehydrogenase (short-subunit alcohol dehydrogenase family)
MSQTVLAPGRVAVVTGAASGIGLAVCKRLAERGMRVWMADVDEEKLGKARGEVAAIAKGGDQDVRCSVTDVSRLSDVQRLQREVWESFGETALLMNNAAAFRFGGAFKDVEAWEKTLAVNVMGVVHGMHAFVPKMLEQGEPSVVINTGSKQGITNPPGMPNYNAAKAAVKSLTESLQHELRNTEGSKVSAHLLVPGWTTTGDREHHPNAWRAEQVADHMIAALEHGDFYIVCPDNEVSPEMDRKRIIWGAMDVSENRPPLSRWHPDYQDQFEAFEPE